MIDISINENQSITQWLHAEINIIMWNDKIIIMFVKDIDSQRLTPQHKIQSFD